MSTKRKEHLRYIGNGDFIPGVPARDLTADESRRFADEIEQAEQATGQALYRADQPITKPAPAAEEVTDA